MKEYIEWFVTSSQDPAKLSLTLKSVAAILVMFGMNSIIVDEGVGHVMNIITSSGVIVSAVYGLVGLYRKVKFGRWSAYKN